jgi:hypothetical protein
MAKFSPGTDTTIAASEPQLDVAVSASAPLKIGKHVFQLVVQDDSGNDSTPAQVTIIVIDTERPTAVADVIDAAGRRNASPQVTIPVGKPFSLTGDRSTDIGGVVKKWTWTLLQP